jgi:hypothetical protein
MMQMWIEGGWGMFPVLVFGLVTLYASGRYAVDGEPVRLRFVAAMSVLLLASMVHSMLTNVAAVFSFLQDPERAPDAELSRILFTGLMESTRPGALGGALLVLALVLVAVGVYRAGRKELRLATA